MRSLHLIPLIIASSVHALPELSISKRDRHNDGASAHFARSIGLEKRQGTVSSNIFDVLSWSFGGAFYTNVSVGTPPQLQTVIIDTGSSDLYFDASSAKTCQKSGRSSCQGGTFDKSKSSTYNEYAASPAFNTSFGDGSSASGPYGQDVIGIGDVLVSPVQFGVAEEVETTAGYTIGLLGLGYSTNEAVQITTGDFYQNLPEVLAAAGEINSRLYSVFLNDADADTGTILFGGIDKTKYTGNLATLDLIPPAAEGRTTGIIDEFITTVTGASASVQGTNTTLWSGGEDGISAYSETSSALPVVLDTGSTAWNVPTSVYNRIIAPAFPYVDEQGICSCEYADSDDSLTLEFGGKISIDIPARQFIVPFINTTTREPIPYDSKNNACGFLISPVSSASLGGALYFPLGDAILRSMYVVFDLDNGQVSIAQANVNSTDSPDIVTVKAGPTGVAEAVGSAVQTAAKNTWSVAAKVADATGSFSVSTAATPLGTATGVGAIPASAQVVGQEESATSSGSSGGKSEKSKGAAPGGVDMGAVEWSVLCGLAVWVVAFGAGFGLVV